MGLYVYFILFSARFGNAPDSYFGPELIAAVQAGTIEESRVDVCKHPLSYLSLLTIFLWLL